MKPTPFDSPDYEKVAVAPILWQYQPTFGPWLRNLREASGLSLREAADELGVSFTRLQKLETGGRARPPDIDVLNRIAALFGRSTEEVYQEAGVRAELPVGFHSKVNYEQDFRVLALHPALCPHLMDETWCESFLFLSKQQWVEFSLKLEAMVLSHGSSVGRILDLKRRSDSHREGSESEGVSTMVRPVPGGVHFIGGQFFYWRFQPTFGAWLRSLREEARYNLRETAYWLGLTFSTLQRLETGARIRPPVDLLWNIVWLFGVHATDVFTQAGLEVRDLEGFPGLDDEERAFAALMLHPQLQPVAMTPHWMQAWPRLHQRQLIEYAWLLERFVLKGEAPLRTVLAKARRQREGEKG